MRVQVLKSAIYSVSTRFVKPAFGAELIFDIQQPGDSKRAGETISRYLAQLPPVPAERKFRIGRSSDNDIVIKTATVSKRHAILERNSKGEWFCEDLGSENGTYINGEKLSSAKKAVQPGDQVLIVGAVIRIPAAAAPKKADVKADQDRLDTSDSVELSSFVNAHLSQKPRCRIYISGDLQGPWHLRCKVLGNQVQAITPKEKLIAVIERLGRPVSFLSQDARMTYTKTGKDGTSILPYRPGNAYSMQRGDTVTIEGGPVITFNF